MSDFSFPSTGDPGKDVEIARSFRKHDGNIKEGICPNGCGPMVSDTPSDSHCEVCSFVYQRRTLGI